MADYMLDFTNDNLEDGKERQAVSEGEYRLRIKDWKSDDDGNIRMMDKNDNPFIMPILEIIDCPEAEYAKDIMHYMPLLHDEMDKKKANDTRFQLNSFWKAFGMDVSQGPIDPESVIGATADAYLVVSEDTGYGEGNRVKRWIVSP